MQPLIQRAFPAAPNEVWQQPIDFSPKLPVGTPAASVTVAISAGHTVTGSPDIGTWDEETREWTSDADGQWVLVKFTAGATLGTDYVVTVTIAGPNGTTPKVQFYAPVARHS